MHSKAYLDHLQNRKPTNPLLLEVLERVAKDPSIPRDKVLEVAVYNTEAMLEENARHGR